MQSKSLSLKVLVKSLVNLKICNQAQIENLLGKYLNLSSSQEDLSLGQYLLQKRLLTPNQLKKIHTLLHRGYYHCLSCRQIYPNPSPPPPMASRKCPQCQTPMEKVHWNQTSSEITPVREERSIQAPEKDNSFPFSSQSTRSPRHLTPVQTPPFQILSPLGQGGFGDVYRARDPLTGRRIAIKILKTHLARDENTKKRFQREINITSRLEHPGIMPVYQCGLVQDGSLYLTMKEIRGGTLKDLFHQGDDPEGEDLTLPQFLEIFLKVCDAVEFAHSKGVIHRDLKPANIAVGDFGEVLVLDWGIAQAGGEEEVQLERKTEESSEEKIEIEGHTLTRDDMLGSPGYMAPEQARGQEVSPSSDIHALGAILYEFLTGKLPFSGSLPKRLFKLLSGPPSPPHQVYTYLKIPPELSAIAHKCLAHEPQNRYQTVAELRKDILRYREGFSVSVRQDTLWEKTAKWIGRNKTLSATLVLLFLTVTITWLGLRVYHNQTKAKIFQKHFEKAREILAEKKFSTADELKESYPHDFSLMKQESPEVKEKRQSSIGILLEVKKKLEQAREIHPHNHDLIKRLFEVEKEIGTLALLGKNFLLAERAFENCVNYDPRRGKSLLELLAQRKREVATAYKKRVREIMSTLKGKPPAEGMYEEYIIDLTKMGTPEVVKELLSYLASDHFWQRKTVIEALGKIGDGLTRYKGRDVVQWLINRLEGLSVEENQDECVALIWALGRLRDVRAYEVVKKKRNESQVSSNFWIKTALPTAWIPLKKIDKNSRDHEAWNKLGRLEMAVKNYERSVDLFTKAIKLDSQNSSYFNNRGLAYYRLEKFNLALDDFNKAVALEPQEFRHYFNRANVHVALGQFDKAIGDSKKVLSLDPQNSSAYFSLGFVYAKMQKWEKAVNHFNKLETIDPDHGSLYTNRGQCYKYLKKYQKAFKDFAKAISSNPKDSDAYCFRGDLYYMFKRYHQALDDFDIAISLDPRNHHYYGRRGAVYLDLNKFRAAIRDFTQALRIKPGDEDYLFNRAIGYGNLKEWKKALEDFNQLLKMNPRDADSLLRRGFIYRELGKDRQAVRDLRKFLKLKPHSRRAPMIRKMLKDYEKNYKNKERKK